MSERVLIGDYRNVIGEHCGSAAMRDLIFHYCGLELSEAMIFGLGSGLDLLFLAGERLEPRVIGFGRTLTMELDVASALGVDYREQPEFDDAHAWEVVRQQVAAGRPTMLSGDVFHLDYREFKTHFPAHRFVLLGYDDARQKAFVADRLRPEVEEVSYAALAKSRNPRDYPMSTFNLWGRFHATEPTRSLPEAIRVALDRNVARMRAEDGTQAALIHMSSGGVGIEECVTGLAGLGRFAASVPTWFDRPDREALLRFGGTNIESYGTGGGNFRRLFANFLSEALVHVPDRLDDAMVARAGRSADCWTALSGALGAASPDECGALLEEIVALETELFDALGR